MGLEYYNGYEKLADIFERYAIYNFDRKLIDYLMGECCQFFDKKQIKPDVFKHFTVEFDISADNSFIGLKGGNLMSTLWLINIYPPEPEKFIQETTCIFGGKKYIYDSRVKSLKIVKYATKQQRHKTYN